VGWELATMTAQDHIHVWYALEVTEDQPEQLYWCVSGNCEATKDSCGGVIV
jgi:hypothetical protein